jgi:hypothetical protein
MNIFEITALIWLGSLLPVFSERWQVWGAASSSRRF